MTASTRPRINAEPALRALLVLELPGIFEVKFRLIELHRLRDFRLHLLEVGDEVAVGEVDSHGQVSTIIFARDGAFAIALGDLCDLGQRNLHRRWNWSEVRFPRASGS